MAEGSYGSNLQYLHPHMETSIVDNSVVTETAIVTQGTSLFMPFFASKGLDNKIQSFTTQAQVLAEYGTPNFRDHGQAYYNALNFVRNGGTLYAMRMLPEAATYANQAVIANFGAGTEAGNGGAEVEQDPLSGRYIVYAIDDEEVAVASTDEDTTDSTEGETKDEVVEDPSLKLALVRPLDNPQSIKTVTPTAKEFPILTVRAKGRGNYGNKLAFSLEVEHSLDDTYDFVVYNLRVFEVTKGGQSLVEGPYQVALLPEAVNVAGTSLFIKNIVERYSDRIMVEVNEANLDMAYDRLQELHDAEVEKLVANDPTYVEKGEFIPYDVDVFGLGDSNNSIAAVLAGGKDGGAEKGDKLSAEQKSELLSKAFSGKAPFDTSIAHKREFPFDILLDANFDEEVKVEMAALAARRGDCMAFLDCGTEATSADEALASKPAVDSPYTAVYGQSATIYDSFNNAYIPVTMTYFLAGKIPANDMNYGIQYPLAGPARGVVSGFQSLSFNPYTDDKEKLYKGKVNYLEQDYRQSKFMSQLTSQAKNTALSNINNMRVLMRMVRSVEEISDNYFFEFATESLLNNFESVINNNLQQWIANGACQTVVATVYQNDYDAVQKIVRVRVEVVFTNIIERIIIEFNVGN